MGPWFCEWLLWIFSLPMFPISNYLCIIYYHAKNRRAKNAQTVIANLTYAENHSDKNKTQWVFKVSYYTEDIYFIHELIEKSIILDGYCTYTDYQEAQRFLPQICSRYLGHGIKIRIGPYECRKKYEKDVSNALDWQDHDRKQLKVVYDKSNPYNFDLVLADKGCPYQLHYGERPCERLTWCTWMMYVAMISLQILFMFVFYGEWPWWGWMITIIVSLCIECHVWNLYANSLSLRAICGWYQEQEDKDIKIEWMLQDEFV